MLSQRQINDIVDHAAVSDLARVNWDGRGRAPIGYVKGMAVTFGLCLQKLIAKDSAAIAMVRYVDGSGERDVFDHYEDRIRGAGLQTEDVGVGRTISTDIDRLRILFVILTGLGMRESSGRYCEGRDRSASNTSAESAEAGLFQMSWDGRRASPEIEKLFDAYANREAARKDVTFDIFKEGVTPHSGDSDNYGTGQGEAFQAYCKVRPYFAVQCAAIGLRTLYTHWGPIVRREAELRPEADALFRQVQAIMGANAPVVAEKPAAGWLSVLVGMLMAWVRAKTVFTDNDPPAPGIKPPAPVMTPWMAWAAKEVGFHETGENRNIGRYTGPAKCGSEGDPWCAIFVNAGLETSGIRGSRSAMARSFETDAANFIRLSGPAFGAITTLWRGSPGSGQGHVFFYIGENDRGILALGGNQSDQVCRQYEPRNRIVGYWWPKSVPLPKIGAIIVNDNANEGTET